ncbi:MAG: M48 family metallopeptidase [Butyrivibrio sp.]|uniref:M48 family metallopeptidase n=1 Tax=Butyrivibrio sp. TaxID=28121 RepID=UPI0025FB8FA1|nr:SprT family zinc-dependent metalloprotease [Butyrivibrio sp.]MCR5769956.1 M48 family metallopeptidase [Butyrivibrio sp.]
MTYNINIIRSNRKTLSLEIKNAGELIVRAPSRLSEKRIYKFIAEKEDWIQKHLQIAALRQESEENSENLSEWDIKVLTKEAQRVIPILTRQYAGKMNVTYGKITIRHQKTRWGSCSSTGNLSFNCMLMKTPRPIQEYVVVHELAHRVEMNHSERFWKVVEKYMPDYRERRKWLKENGSHLI